MANTAPTKRDFRFPADAGAISRIWAWVLGLRSAPQALSGAGAISTATATTLFTSTGAGQALTLADGTTGQRKRIVHVVDGGSGVITQTTGAKLTASITTITFTNIWDWVELEWSGSLWNVVAYGGVTIA